MTIQHETIPDSKFQNDAYTGPRDDILDLIPNNVKNILDVGCSIGTLGSQIKQRFSRSYVIGIESDEEAASLALTHLDDVINADVENLDFELHMQKQFFDCIIFADVLEHLKDPWTLIDKSINYLQYGGTIIASIPNIRHYNTLLNLFIRGWWPYRERGIHDKTHLRFFTKKNIIELFDQTNLNVVKIVPKYRIIERPHKANWISKYFALPIIKEFITFQYLIVCKRSLVRRL